MWLLSVCLLIDFRRTHNVDLIAVRWSSLKWEWAKHQNHVSHNVNDETQAQNWMSVTLTPTVTTVISSSVSPVLSSTPCQYGWASSCSVTRSPSSAPLALSLCLSGSSFTTRPGRSRGKPYRPWLLSRTTNHYCRTRTSKLLSLTEDSALKTKMLLEMKSRC